MKEVLLVLLCSGGIITTIIQWAKERMTWKRNRKAVKEDKAEEQKSKEQQDLRQMVEALYESQKYVLYDRIRFLGLSYIEAGEVDFDDRRILNNMWHSYHYGLNANGDLDELMSAVNQLPLKQR